MTQEILTDLSTALVYLRLTLGWTQAELADVAGIPRSELNDYEHGRKRLIRSRLEHLISFMGLAPERIDAALADMEATRAAARPDGAPLDRFEQRRRRIQAVAAQVGRLAESFARSVLTLLSLSGESIDARDRAEVLWSTLKRKNENERLALVEKDRRFRTWGLVILVCEESREAAANEPKEARSLAHLAVRIAELVGGSKEWRWRLQGLATAWLANAHRACQDLLAAEKALKRALKLWEDGAPGDPGLLNPAVLPWIEAALRRAQRKFPQAVKKIDEALELDSGELRAKILLTKSKIHEALGETAASAEALMEAAPLIDAEREPRLAWVLEFQVVFYLCSTGCPEEAALRLYKVKKLAERLRGESDLDRVVWLDAVVAAALGKPEKAKSLFEQVRRAFDKPELRFDFALVSLDLSLVHLEQGNTAAVRTIANEMFPIFRSQGIHREALAALRVFCEAAKQDAASVKLTRSVLRFLHRAKDDPELRFEECEWAEA